MKIKPYAIKPQEEKAVLVPCKLTADEMDMRHLPWVL